MMTPFVLLALCLCAGSSFASVDIHIGGIFKIDSVSEKAFSMAILKHNQKPNRKFRIRSTLAMLPRFESNEIINKICEMAAQNRSVAIFGGQFTFVIQEVKDIARVLQVPIFTTDFDTGDMAAAIGAQPATNKGKFLIHMYPPVIGGLVEFLVNHGWTAFSYVCNTGHGLYRLQAIIQRLHSRHDYVELNIDVRYISDPRLATKDLRNLDSYLSSMETKRILIDVDSKTDLELVLHRVVLMGMNRPEYQYVIVGTNIEEINLQEFRYSGVDIIGFKIVADGNAEFANFSRAWREWTGGSGGGRHEAALMLDAVNVFTAAMERIIDNPHSRKFLLKYVRRENNVNCYTLRSPSRRRLIGYHNRQYEVKNSSLGQMLLSHIINDVPRKGFTGPLRFRDDGLRDNIVVKVMRNVMDEGLVQVGEWVQGKGLNVSVATDHRQLSRKGSMKNKTIRVVTIESKPFIQKRVPKDNEKLEGNNMFEGFCMDLLNMTANLLGFSYEVHLVHDRNYGVRIGVYPNKTEIWNGMIGELLNNTADMVVAPLTINLARAKVVHFSEPFLTFGLSVMIKKPGKKKAGIFSFLRPLSYPVWGCYIAACLVVSCGLYIIARLSPYEWNTVTTCNAKQTVTRDLTFFNCVWFSIAAFVQQGVDVSPKSPGARILSSVWWFFTLIMIAYYTANLAAFLTISLIITPINDWNDLIKPSIGIEYGSTNSGSTKTFFLTTPIQPYKTMGSIMKANPHVFASSPDDGVDRVRKSKGNYAFILESRTNEYYNNRLPCDTMMVGTQVGDNGYGIATSLNYPHKEELTDAILKLREKQELTKLYTKWWIEKGECNEDSSKSNSGALLLINVAGVFYILAGGLTFAMIISLVEFYFNSKKYYQKNQVKENSWYSNSTNCGSGHGNISDSNRPLRLAEQDNINY